MAAQTRQEIRKRLHDSLRKRLAGTSDRPRLVVFRSARYIYVQVVDDGAHRTLASASDLPAFEGAAQGKKSERAKRVGALIAKRCLDQGIKQVVFDRGGYQYHGRVKEVASGAREGGLEF
jgi:large subunit ribosomal protein L18